MLSSKIDQTRAKFLLLADESNANADYRAVQDIDCRVIVIGKQMKWCTIPSTQFYILLEKNMSTLKRGCKTNEVIIYLNSPFGMPFSSGTTGTLIYQ